MGRKLKFVIIAVPIVAFIVVAAVYLAHTNIPVLEPKGIIGEKERNLIVFALLLSLIVVIPVFTLLILFAWKYREGNHAAYSPKMDHSLATEMLWWFIPSVLIAILSVVTWNSSHTLDPYRPIASTTKPLVIQVVALDWKWLFIYPKQDVASVNFLQLPLNTPVDFQITSDTVMNSFWLPQLGGQIYAMPGMSTTLYLMASQAGSYNGSSANISGNGFANMTFVARAGSQQDFSSWLDSVRHSPKHLSSAAYTVLTKPTMSSPVVHYSSVQPGLYNTIMMKYMAPVTAASTSPQTTSPKASLKTNMPTMNMPYMEMP